MWRAPSAAAHGQIWVELEQVGCCVCEIMASFAEVASGGATMFGRRYCYRDAGWVDVERLSGSPLAWAILFFLEIGAFDK